MRDRGRLERRTDSDVKDRQFALTPGAPLFAIVSHGKGILKISGRPKMECSE